MASALLEALENGSKSWKRLDIQILPGITAMLAAAAQLGAPLGHDFCAINLSDNLKPWEIIEKRLRLSLEADFVISLYNPRSVARPFQFDKVLRIVNDTCQTDRLIIFAKSVTTPKQNIRIFNINEAKSEMVDMSTIVIIGSSRTRRLKGTRFVYTPRST
jgi:precorrin-3B C17-methyltransferase